MAERQDSGRNREPHGGFGSYDPRLEDGRHRNGRESPDRESRQDGRYGADYERGDQDVRGDWRQGYGGYGVSESGGMREDEVVERAPDYEGLSGGYGFGARMGDTGRGDEPWPYLEPWAVPGPFTGRGPKGYERSGEIIREDVCERLTRHGRLDASRIHVAVERGAVVLEGTVDSTAAKRMAEETAETVAGVQHVHNRLRIRGDTDTGAGGAEDSRRRD